MWTHEPESTRRNPTRSALLIGGAVLAATTLGGCTAEAPLTAPSSAATGAGVRPQALPSAGQVEPGVYAFEVDRAPAGSPVPLVSVPEGFTSVKNGFGVRSGNWVTDDARVLTAWDIDSVYTHPCEAGASAAPVGPTVQDLADALAAQPMRSGTDPVPVTVGGHDGLYVELSVPDIDLSACPGGYFNSWPGRYQQVPGQVDMLWVLDVDGQRLVLDASYAAGVEGQQLAELKDMVTTATFSPAG